MTWRDYPHYVRLGLQKIQERWSTLLTGVVATYWDVTIGQGCTFVGVPSIVRCRGSVVVMGARGRFLSAARSNRHGLSRPVMISTLRPHSVISIGDDVGMSGTVICAAQSVRIGNRVMLGANTTITDTDSHPLHFRDRFAAYYGRDPRLPDTATKVAPVVIEDDVFVGMHAIILKGVTIGRCAVVAAGSIVTQDVPTGAIVGGVPARVLGYTDGG